ncbi:MAG: cytochrome c-type biogenesis protein CcmH [Chloroflexi bacterium]|nr:cytochrome c-type biogenesis protein CcmH [Chloroflexota bacterium]
MNYLVRLGVGLIVVALSLIPAVAGADSHWDLVVLSPEARAIALKVQCPICEGESIAASQATIAKQMRVILQEKVDAGWSEAQILDYFREAYGPAVLREPPRSGVALGIWLVPPAILLAGLAAIVLLLRGWLRRPAPVEEVPEPADEEVVAREMARLRRGDGR